MNINGIVKLNTGELIGNRVFISKLKTARKIKVYENRPQIDIEVTINENEKFILEPHHNTEIYDQLYISWENIMENHMNEFSNLERLVIESRNPYEWTWDLNVDLPPSLTYLSIPIIPTVNRMTNRMTGVTTLEINANLVTNDDDEYDINRYDEYSNITTLKIHIHEDNVEESEKLTRLSANLKTKFTKLQRLILWDMETDEPIVVV